MLRHVAAVAIVAASVSACSTSSSSSERIDTSDPNTAVRQARESMAGLGSYHMQLTFSPEDNSVTVPVDYDDGDYYEKITDPASGGVTELIMADSLYTRTCDGATCEPWIRKDSPVTTAGSPLGTKNRYSAPSLGGLTTTFPETLAFTAVEIATGWQALPGSPTILIGQVDLGQAVTENRTRAGNPPASGQPSDSPLQPSTIELTLSDSGPYFERVRIDLPGNELDPYFVADFSKINDVSVEAPGEYTIEASN
ncbi:MAG: hypothetical protein ABI559_07225 [Chloroflexota bacterium]